MDFLALQSITLDLRVALANKAMEIANHEVLMMVCKMQNAPKEDQEELGNKHCALLQDQDDLVLKVAKEYMA
jgi:hypothetical protein